VTVGWCFTPGLVRVNTMYPHGSMAGDQSHFGPATQPLGRVCMTTPQPHLYSSLPIITCSTGRCVRLAAYRLSFPLSTRAYQFHAEGGCCLPFTGEVRVDDSPCWEYHLTHMGTQLSKITRPLPLISRTLRHGFERTGRTIGFQPTPNTRAFWERYLAWLSSWSVGNP